MINVFKNEAGKIKVLKSYNELLSEWGTDYIEEDVKTAFGKTHCIIAGNKSNPPLLLFHGVGDNSAVMWVLNIKSLAEHFFCIAVDTIGGPGKSEPNESYNKQSFSQQSWINEIADYYKLETFNIAGVSNGAAMAFNYTVSNGGRVRRAVCMEGGMVLNPMKAMIDALGMMFPEILFPTNNNMKKVLRKLSSPNSSVYNEHPEIVDHIILMMKSHNQKAMFAHKIEKYNKEAAIKVRDKLYFILGDYNIEHKKEFIHVLEDGHFKYKIIKNAGHGVNHEQAEEVNHEIINFL